MRVLTLDQTLFPLPQIKTEKAVWSSETNQDNRIGAKRITQHLYKVLSKTQKETYNGMKV